MAAIDLTTVANVVEWMPAPSGTPTTTVTAKQTSILQAAITAASMDFLKRTGRGPSSGVVPSQSPFVQAVSYTETYNGNGNNQQFLRNSPVLSVQSVTVNGTVLPSSAYVIDDKAKSIILQPGGIQSPVPFMGTAYCRTWPRFPRGIQNIQVQYTAGFAAQTVSSELDTIPASPGPYVVTPDFPWLADGGVKYFSNGNPFTAVQIAPAQGQYFLNNGTYLFNAADAGLQILLSYSAAGTPPDIELAVRRMVFLTYQRRSWEGLASLAKPESGQTSYRSWEVDPSVLEVIQNYTRTAIV